MDDPRTGQERAPGVIVPPRLILPHDVLRGDDAHADEAQDRLRIDLSNAYRAGYLKARGEAGILLRLLIHMLGGEVTLSVDDLARMNSGDTEVLETAVGPDDGQVTLRVRARGDGETS